MAYLVVVDSAGERRIELGDRLVIGRDKASDVVLDDPMVSLRHAEVRRAGDGFEIADLGSRHGTYVREAKIKTSALQDGDEILLGVHRLRFEERGAGAAANDGLQFDDVTPPFQTRIAVQRTQFRSADELSEHEIRADYEKLRAAFEIAAAAGDEREIRPLLERILHSAISVMGAERTAAVLVDPSDGTPFLRLTANKDSRDEVVSLSTKLLAEVMRRREGVMVGGPQMTAGRSESMAAQRIRTAMCAPLLYRDQVLGVLYVDSRITGRRFEAKDLEVLVALANQAAGSLKAALSIDEVERVRSEARERTEQVLRHLPEGVVLLDGERRIAFANDVAAEILAALDIEYDQPLPATLGGIPLDKLAGGRFHRFEPARQPRRILDAAAIPTDDSGGLLLVLRDVTAERVREEESERQERLAIVGRLVAGVAHDLNNVLTVILTCADALRDNDDPSDVQLCAADIAEAGKRAARLNRQLLVFSATSSGKIETVDAADVVEQLGTLWGRLLADRIRIEIRCSARPAPVQVDRSHLEQAILNLVVNARDAARPGGSLVLEVREAATSLEARAIEILAIDDGVGMEPEVAERIFEPFFTTKGAAGTGLGLATVHRVVRGANGTIDVRSRPGEGTTFRIVLPRATATPSRSSSDSARTAGARTGTVLLVEDHDAVREAAARTLRAAGHRVIASATAEDALAQAERHDGAIDVLVADLVLPGMTGLDLAAQLRRSHSALHVVYMSGYLDETTSVRVAREGALFLAKPFGGHALLAQIAARSDD
jgi:signal transduction histidine kinase